MTNRPRILRFERFALDLGRRTLSKGDRQIELRPKSMHLLTLLAVNAGRTVPKDELFSEVWPDVTVTDESLTRCISDIRLALDDGDHQIIKTMPRQGYVLVAPVTSEAAVEGGSASSVRSIQDRPSIAVLPFYVPAESTNDEFIGEGIADELILELTRFSELIVIAANSSFRFRNEPRNRKAIAAEIGAEYLIDGTIWYRDGQFTLTVQLIDARTNSYLWSDRFESGMGALRALSRDIVGTIAGLVSSYVIRAETDRALDQQASAGRRSQELYMKAAGLVRRFYGSYADVTMLYEVRRLLDQVLDAEPQHARAVTALAGSRFATYLHKFDQDFLDPQVLKDIKGLVLRAIAIDPTLAEAYDHLGHVLLHAGEHDAAIAAHNRARELNPNAADWRFAIALVFGGEHERAIDVVRSCLRRDPYCSPIALGWMGRAFYQLKQYREALLPLTESAARATGWRGAPLVLAAVYARLGDDQKARECAAEVLRREPQWTISTTGRRINRLKHQVDADHFFEGLRLAGLPEG